MSFDPKKWAVEAREKVRCKVCTWEEDCPKGKEALKEILVVKGSRRSPSWRKIAMVLGKEFNLHISERSLAYHVAEHE